MRSPLLILTLGLLALVPRLQAAQSFKIPQTLDFGAIADKKYGDPDFVLTAKASSGLAVVFSIVEGPARISGNRVTLTGVGRVTVRASQAGNLLVKSVSVDRPFTVSPASVPVSSVSGGSVLVMDPSHASASLTGGTLTLTGGAVTSTGGNFVYHAAANYSGTLSFTNTVTIATTAGMPPLTPPANTAGPRTLQISNVPTLITNPNGIQGPVSPFTTAGSSGLAKSGTGNVALSGTSTYTSGGTLTLTGGPGISLGTNFLLAGGSQYIQLTIPGKIVSPGQDAVFSPNASLSGFPTMAYQWQCSTDGGLSWANLTDNETYSGSLTGTLTVHQVTPSMNGYLFKCLFTSVDSTYRVTGTVATLTVQ